MGKVIKLDKNGKRIDESLEGKVNKDVFFDGVAKSVVEGGQLRDP